MRNHHIYLGEYGAEVAFRLEETIWDINTDKGHIPTFCLAQRCIAGATIRSSERKRRIRIEVMMLASEKRASSSHINSAIFTSGIQRQAIIKAFRQCGQVVHFIAARSLLLDPEIDFVEAPRLGRNLHHGSLGTVVSPKYETE
jgi:hypothetical protein